MSVLESFERHVDSVHRLMNFDRDVLSFAIDSIEQLRQRLTQHHGLDNPHLTAARTLELLRGYRDHGSLRPRYKTIFNQALVLLVSYFGSSVHDVFRNGISAALASDTDSALLREQIKISFAELKEANFELRTRAPDLLINAKDIGFQDMKSIARAFKENLGLDIERTQVVNDIISAQACRHVIVHSGSVADDALVRQLSGAHPRTLKPKVFANEHIESSLLTKSRLLQFPWLSTFGTSKQRCSSAMRPNPSLERTSTGKAPGPRGAHCVHHAPRGPGALPVASAQLKR